MPIGSLWICTSAYDPARRAEPLARELLSARFSSPDPSPSCHLSLTTLHSIYTNQALVRSDPNDTYIRDTQARAKHSEMKALSKVFPWMTLGNLIRQPFTGVDDVQISLNPDEMLFHAGQRSKSSFSRGTTPDAVQQHCQPRIFAPNSTTPVTCVLVQTSLSLSYF